MKEKLDAMKIRMPKHERKMLHLEAEKEILMKANFEIKSTLEGKEDVIVTKWKDVLLREAPKFLVHKKLAMYSNTTNRQETNEQYKIERRKNNVVIEACKKLNQIIHFLL